MGIMSHRTFECLPFEASVVLELMSNTAVYIIQRIFSPDGGSDDQGLSAFVIYGV